MRIDYRTLKVGDVFYTKSINHYTVIIAPAVEQNGEFTQWRWLANDDEGSVEFLITEGLEHYGPELYDSPAYVKFNDKRLVDDGK